MENSTTQHLEDLLVSTFLEDSRDDTHFQENVHTPALLVELLGKQ